MKTYKLSHEIIDDVIDDDNASICTIECKIHPMSSTRWVARDGVGYAEVTKIPEKLQLDDARWYLLSAKVCRDPEKPLPILECTQIEPFPPPILPRPLSPLPWEGNDDVCDNCGSENHYGVDCELPTNPASLKCDECCQSKYYKSPLSQLVDCIFNGVSRRGSYSIRMSNPAKS